MKEGGSKFHALREEMEQISGHLSPFVSRYRIFEEGRGRRIVFAKELTVSRAKEESFGEERDTVCRVLSPRTCEYTPGERVGKGRAKRGCRRVAGEVDGRGRAKRWIKKHEWKRNACWLSQRPMSAFRDLSRSRCSTRVISPRVISHREFFPVRGFYDHL